MSLGNGSTRAIRICSLKRKGQQKKSMPNLFLPWASVVQSANLVIWQCSFKLYLLLSVAQTMLQVVFIYKISQEHRGKLDWQQKIWELDSKTLGIHNGNTYELLTIMLFCLTWNIYAEYSPSCYDGSLTEQNQSAAAYSGCYSKDGGILFWRFVLQFSNPVCWVFSPLSLQCWIGSSLKKMFVLLQQFISYSLL